MNLVILVAHDLNNLIGYNNVIPWHYPEYVDWKPYIKYDLAFFKKATVNRTIIVGRTTYQTLPKAPLPNRTNLVISKRNNFDKDSSETAKVITCPSLEKAFELAPSNEEVYIVGGAQIYDQTLPKVNKIYRTQFLFKFEGGTGNRVFFPKINESEWVYETLNVLKDSHNNPKVIFERLIRK